MKAAAGSSAGARLYPAARRPLADESPAAPRRTSNPAYSQRTCALVSAVHEYHALGLRERPAGAAPALRPAGDIARRMASAVGDIALKVRPPLHPPFPLHPFLPPAPWPVRPSLGAPCR